MLWCRRPVPGAPFTALQTRIQRIKPGPKVLAQAPARVLAYDLPECEGADWREKPLQRRPVRARCRAALRLRSMWSR